MKYRHHLSRQILAGCLVFMLILGMLITTITLSIFGNGMNVQYKTLIQDVLNLTMAQIDVRDLETCMQTGVPSEAFAALNRFMDNVRQNCSLEYLVICRPVKEGDRYDVKAVAHGLLPEERAGEKQKLMDIPELGDSIGAMYPEAFVVTIYNDMMNRQDIKFSTSKTEFGVSYDGAVSILNADGEPIALLTAGLSVNSIKSAMLRYGLLLFGGIIAAVLLFLMMMNYWLNRRVVRPLKLIEGAAAEFAQKSGVGTDPEALVISRPEIHSGDELESLADTIVSLSENMKAYAEHVIHSAIRLEDMKQQITKANDLALKDALTGVRNKNAFHRELQALDLEIESGIPEFGLMMIDLNNLKQINDSYGHDKGDAYLKNACKLVCDTFAHSPVYRIGGDEFVVVLRNADLVNRDALFARFRDGMRADSHLEPWQRISAAFGLAFYEGEEDASAEDVLAKADRRMYENKRNMKASQD